MDSFVLSILKLMIRHDENLLFNFVVVSKVGTFGYWTLTISVHDIFTYDALIIKEVRNEKKCSELHIHVYFHYRRPSLSRKEIELQFCWK